MEQMAKLKPAFIKPHGTITAANASFLVSFTNNANIFQGAMSELNSVHQVYFKVFFESLQSRESPWGGGGYSYT